MFLMIHNLVFRDNHNSTTDCIFLLHSIIQKVFNNKSKLYCLFMDYKKAFDTVNSDALWVKLLRCKMINMVEAVYSLIKLCVRNIL